ncbi:MAG: hypothetical protein IKC77_01895 [Lentisphaeria bacterium]|nr:hypothetical protein [Lentisphaeria bacterium]
MKRFLPVLSAVLLLCSGCVTSTVTQIKAAPGERSASGKRVVAHLQGMNSGVFLFYYIPLWSGKENRPNNRDYDTFRNRVEKKHMRKMLDLQAKRLGADEVENLSIHTKSSGIWTLWIFWKRSVHGVGTAVKSKK